jgi:hypothetical protein
LAHPDDIEEAGRFQLVFEQKVDYYEMEARLKHKYNWVWTLDYGKSVRMD